MKPLVVFFAFLLAGTGCARVAAPQPDAPAREPAASVRFDGIRSDISAIKSDLGGLGTCHERMHALGQRAYADFGAAAIEVGDEWCNAGYIHGVIEAALAGSEDPISEMASLCAPFPAGSFSAWECWHGVGHGLMYYTANDLPRSVALCESVPGDASACVNGVWMENFIADGTDHVTAWRREDDSFYPCDANVADGAGDCYLYVPVWYLARHDHDYAAAFEWCRGAGAYADSCAHGVGSQAMKDNVGDPDAAAKTCDLAFEEDRDACLEGMAGILAFHNASLGPADAWCERREADDRGVCEARLDALRPMFD